MRGIVDGTLQVGDMAADFELPALIDGVRKTFRLSDHCGKTVLLAFYPFNWQEASVRQMAAYQAQRQRWQRNSIEIAAVSVESIMNTTAWERRCGPFDFTLCSDFWPHGEVSAQYGAFRSSGPAAGECERAVVIVDAAGRIAFRRIYARDEVPPLDDLFNVLAGAGLG